jgi:predicted nucleotidyltransferase
MASREIIDIVHRYGQRLIEEGLPVERLILYGSHARGTPHRDSDIDVMVLLNDSVTRTEIHDLWTRMAVLTVGVDSRIETWPVTVSRFHNDDVSPLIIVAREEGIPIAA